MAKKHKSNFVNNTIGYPQSGVNRTQRNPVPGKKGDDAYEVWKQTEGEKYPEIQTKEDWINSGYGYQLGVYKEFEI